MRNWRLVTLSLALSLAVLLAGSACDGDSNSNDGPPDSTQERGSGEPLGQAPSAPEVVRHKAFVRPVEKAKAGEEKAEQPQAGEALECTVVDGAGHPVEVIPGDWVIWINEVGRQVTLRFSPDMRLFGVTEAILYEGNEPLELKVRSDAEFTTPQKRHWIRIAGPCVSQAPPPEIIVTPPN
jgi:hypothetical protein